MTALKDMLDNINLVSLMADECGYEVVQGLVPERGGIICDPRPGYTERHPSFSVYRAQSGRWRWKRHGGGDQDKGDAFTFLLAMGYTPKQAHDRLASLAGVSEQASTFKRRPEYHAPTQIEIARQVLKQCSPFTEDELGRLTSLILPLASHDPAAHELIKRGLCGWADLQAGKLRRDWFAQDGRLLAHAGALALPISGPDGQIWGLKIRNLGSKEELDNAKLARYIYRLGKHGAPAWCSPLYGQGEALLITEGELNGAAASYAFSHTGLKIDVQGLAGAGGMPHLAGIQGKAIYLYADPDNAGQACIDRLGELAQQAGAHEVRVLASETQDFCDLLANLGPAALAGKLVHQIEQADYWQKSITGKIPLPVNNAVQHAKNDYWQTGNTYQGWSAEGASEWSSTRGGW